MKGGAGESTFSPMVTLALESRSLGGLKHTRTKFVNIDGGKR